MRKYLITFSLLLLPIFSNTVQSTCLPCLPWLLDYQPSSFYVSGFGGIAGGYEIECKSVKMSRGYYGGLNAGKKIFPNFRCEADIIWQGNDVNSITMKAATGASTDLAHPRGSMNMGSIMANGIFDFNLPFPGSPSLGAGIGYAYASGHWSGKLTQTNDNVFIERPLKSSFKKGALAWQIIADLNFFVCDKLKINIEYRFFKLENKLSTNRFGLSLVKFF